jgi:hypothetical protein
MGTTGEPVAGQRIRGTHPYVFRSGQWAELVGTQDDPESGRRCYAVKFPDGEVDWWPVEDEAAGYEFAQPGAGAVSEQTPAGAAHGPADAPGGTLSAKMTRQAMDDLYFGPRLPLDAEEAARLETAAQRAHKIASMISTGEIGPGLPPGYRFEFDPSRTLLGRAIKEGRDPLGAWFGRHGTREAEKWFPGQVRGTAPEPPPDGFLIPPGLAEALGFSMTREAYPLPPPSWRTRLRWRLTDLRESAAQCAFRVIAGYWPHDGEDDW